MVFSDLDMRWDGKTWRLHSPLTYMHRTGKITVPEGFTTDLDSVPRLPLAYWLLKNRSTRPAVLHDFLYYSQAGKAYADSIFLDAMADADVPAWQRYPIYLGVRLFGGPSYRKYARVAA